jgi:hypothetical protein
LENFSRSATLDSLTVLLRRTFPAYVEIVLISSALDNLSPAMTTGYYEPSPIKTTSLLKVTRPTILLGLACVISWI